MDQLVQNFVTLETQIKNLNTQLKELKENKQDISKQMIDLMQNNDVAYVKLPNNDGFICLKSSFSYEAINKSHLNDTLHGFFKENHSIKTKTDPDTIAQHILESREKKEKTFLQIKKRI